MPKLLFSSALLDKQVATSGFSGAAVTPSDSVDLLDGPCQALFITGAGNVNVNLAASPSGTNTAVLAVAANTIVRIACTRVLSTSTTATGVFALYTRAV